MDCHDYSGIPGDLCRLQSGVAPLLSPPARKHFRADRRLWIRGVFAILLAWGLWGRFHGGRGQLFAGYGSIAMFAFFVFVYPLLRIVQLRRCYRALFPDRSQRKLVLAANDEQLISAIPGTAETRYSWNAFQNFAENKNGMILFVNKRRFIIVPRHAFTEAQWMEFRALVTEKTNAKALVA